MRSFGRYVSREGTSDDDRRELQRIIDQLGKALQHKQSDADKSIIHVMLATMYLTPASGDCDAAKRHSSAAMHLDPASDDALQIDVATGFCFGERTGDYGPLIERLESLAARGKTLPAHYSILGNGYQLRAVRTKDRADLLKAKAAFVKAKERGEPEGTPDTFTKIIESLDQDIRELTP
jgi:hypothetical protein